MLERLEATRIVADPEALDRTRWPKESIVLRIAADDVVLIGAADVVVDDPAAIVVRDAGWSGIWVTPEAAESFLDGACEWARPVERPAFAQGMVAHLAMKIWFEPTRVLFVVPQTLAVEFASRAPASWSVTA